MKFMQIIKSNWRTLVVGIFMVFTIYKLHMLEYAVYDETYYVQRDIQELGYQVSEILERLGR